MTPLEENIENPSNHTPTIKPGFTLWKQGAEARLYSGLYFGKKTVIKERFNKTYRHPALDEAISKERLKAEARGLLRCKAAGVRSPTVYFLDLESQAIYLEKIEGPTVNAVLQEMTEEVKILSLADVIGKSVARIHTNGLMHGDLTTSNMLYVDDEIYLIDFGLSTVSQSAEDKAVDLYVLERAITSSHDISEEFFLTIINSYRLTNTKGGREVLRKYEEVKARGRKRTMVG